MRVQLNSVTPTTVDLLWDAPQSNNLDYYEIFVIPPDGSLLSQGTVTRGDPLMFRVDFLQPDTEYRFRVDAVLSSTGDFDKQSNKNSQEVTQATGKFKNSKAGL